MNLAIIDCKIDRRTDGAGLEKANVEAETLDKPGAKVFMFRLLPSKSRCTDVGRSFFLLCALLC